MPGTNLQICAKLEKCFAKSYLQNLHAVFRMRNCSAKFCKVRISQTLRNFASTAEHTHTHTHTTPPKQPLSRTNKYRSPCFYNLQTGKVEVFLKQWKHTRVDEKRHNRKKIRVRKTRKYEITQIRSRWSVDYI